LKYTFMSMVKKTESGNFNAYFPDLPECISSATTFERVLDSARNALLLHLTAMIEEKSDIPKCSLFDKYLGYKSNFDTVAYPVSVSVPPEYPTEIPMDSLERIRKLDRDPTTYIQYIVKKILPQMLDKEENNGKLKSWNKAEGLIHRRTGK
jgi:predicted RNase H-like HicB family nuclease